MAEVADVLAVLVDRAGRRGLSCRRIGADTIAVEGVRCCFTLSLSDLGRLLAAESRDLWSALVDDCLTSGMVGCEIDREAPLDEGDFSAVRMLIRTRLYSSNDRAADAVRRVLAPGLVQRVVLDAVHTVRPVTYAMLARWPIGEHQLFALAEANVRGDDPPEIATLALDGVDMGAGLSISLLSGPEYTTTHLRWLGEYPGHGPRGAIAVVPSKRCVYACPADTMDRAFRATVVLARLATRAYAERPWPVSPHVYMWRNGQVDLAAMAARTDDGVAIYPTDDFHGWLATLDG
ncbi:hypothetical protein IU474_25125 [Nocardia otitidiscaviarum]|uniref:hypothetical protein n=1 Tax=Nocardia otitidiscaviarum TaxID=1823 RepID=UPI0018932208|nr:hypothetical protein [Nocardia otitidiscaviarum]MBF6240330.1 hypothetical protein [Nocardia otitidiscaviarum]